MRQKGVGIVDSLFFAERYLFIFFEKRFQWGAVEKIEGDEDISQWFYIIRNDAVYFLGKRKIEISFFDRSNDIVCKYHVVAGNDVGKPVLIEMQMVVHFGCDFTESFSYLK